MKQKSIFLGKSFVIFKFFKLDDEIEFDINLNKCFPRIINYFSYATFLLTHYKIYLKHAFTMLLQQGYRVTFIYNCKKSYCAIVWESEVIGV